MKRRDAIVGIAWFAAMPSALKAQQAKLARIGILTVAPAAIDAERIEAFRQGLRELGYVEGKNVVLEYRSAEGGLDRLQSIAAELVRRKVDVILAGSTPAIQAAKNATRVIPIVMATNADPIGMGFVASLARPGGNITGMSSIMPELAGKRLELIKLILPGVSRVGFLLHGADPAHGLFLKEAQDAARTLGMSIVPAVVGGPEHFDAAFAAMAKENVGAVIVQPIFISHYRKISEMALGRALPTISDIRFFADAGGLVSYGPDTLDNYRRAAGYVVKILRGAKPADLPVEQPTKFELVVNLRTAKALNLEIPRSLLQRADKVID